MVQQAVSVAGTSDVFHRIGGVVEIRELPERDVAVIRTSASMATIKDTIGSGLGELMETCQRAAIPVAGVPFVRYLSWGDAVEMEIGVPVLSAIQPAGRVVPSRLPGGRAATLVHVGPYETIERSYATMQAWFAEHGVTPGGTMWESYWTDPDTSPDPATWRTEMVWPFG